MAEHFNRHPGRRYLAAFADGELDVERNLQVLEQLAMDPKHTNRVVHQQQLKQAVARAMHGPEQAPPALRQRIEALAEGETGTGVEPHNSGAVDSSAAAGSGSGAAPGPGAEANDAIPFSRGQAQRRDGSWPTVRTWSLIAGAAAVVLAVALLLPLDYSVGSGNGKLMSPAKAARFGKRHVKCARGLQQLLNTSAYPTKLAELPEALQRRLDRQPVAGKTLDLGPLGYRFEKAGDCYIPGNRAAHIIYQAREGTGRSDAVSLWLRPATGKLAIEPGKLYDATWARTAHPVLLWKHDDIVYSLVGDGPRRTRKAARLLHSRATTP
jgi:hypothetical protein